MRFSTCVVILCAVLTTTAFGQDLGTVKVTAKTANLRAEPNDKAPVLSQAKAGTILVLKAIEGDWFKVQLPGTGALRVDAFISKKVAAVESTTPKDATAKPDGSPGSPSATKVGMTVLWQIESNPTWLVPEEARIGQLSARGDSVRAIAAALPAELHPPMDAGETPVAYVWALPPLTAPAKVIDHRRPTFIVQYKDVPGVSPDDLVPALVRLSASPTGHRVVSMARSRADQISRTTADWEVMRDLRQEVVRSAVQVLESGTARVQPQDDLPPGDYAVVVRAVARKKLAGVQVLSPSTGEGRVFSAAWVFTIK